MITLNEIAKRCNVSKMTVSRTLNPDTRNLVAPETRDRILAIARQHNYRPSALVRALQTGRTQMIGFIGYSSSDHFLGELFSGVQEALYGQGYDFLNLRWSPQVEDVDRLLKSIVDRRLDGVLIAQGDETKDYRYLAELQAHRVPVVAVDREVPISSISFVGSDDAAGTSELVRHLAERGHRHILYIADEGHMRLSTTRRRLEGYRQAMGERGLTPMSECIIPLEPRGQDLYVGRIAEVLERQNKVTAVCANNDVLAARVMLAAARIGRSVPHDLSITGYSNEPIAALLNPGLTTIHQEPRQIGREAAHLLAELIEAWDDPAGGKKPASSSPATRKLVPIRLVQRGSVAPCP